MLDLVTASVQSTKDREKFKDDFSSLGSLKRDDPADGTDFTICSVICVGRWEFLDLAKCPRRRKLKESKN